ncbi:MAG: SDR family oxidoreductase [Marinomonas sp.]|mgnify:CR=1 FL=1|uniref:SDR family oxidoreductase n=1 Tax=Marinomonas sp. TaxID=1904862 RepID=UPI003C7460CE
MNWQQQTCLLTGATGGIGQAIAHALASKGVTLILQGRNEERLLALAALLPGDHQILVADLATASGLTAISEAMTVTPEFSMLINNAGIGQFSALQYTSAEEANEVINTNLTAPILLTQRLLPLLNKDSESHIINVGSVLGGIGFAGQSLYCASKFGLRGFSEALYRELADTNIRVSYFAPRATATSINSQQAMAMNAQLGTAVDTADKVAKALIDQLEQGKSRRVVGFPEKLFVKINGAFPSIVDKALLKKLPVIKRFIFQNTKEAL